MPLTGLIFFFPRTFVNLVSFSAHFFLFARRVRVEAEGDGAVWCKVTQGGEGCQTKSRHMVMLESCKPGIIINKTEDPSWPEATN